MPKVKGEPVDTISTRKTEKKSPKKVAKKGQHGGYRPKKAIISTNEIRVKYTSMRVENGEVVFTF